MLLLWSYVLPDVPATFLLARLQIQEIWLFSIFQLSCKNSHDGDDIDGVFVSVSLFATTYFKDVTCTDAEQRVVHVVFLERNGER